LHICALLPLSTLSLPDALPISACRFSSPPVPLLPPCRHADAKVSVVDSGLAGLEVSFGRVPGHFSPANVEARAAPPRVERINQRSEEHTSELQSRENLVCRLLL